MSYKGLLLFPGLSCWQTGSNSPDDFVFPDLPEPVKTGAGVVNKKRLPLLF
jgi:hypothetical protein